MTRHQTIVRALGGKLSLGAFCIATSGAAILESWSVLLTGMAVFVGVLV